MSFFYRFSQQAWVFVDEKPFQASLIYDGKAGAYLSEALVAKSNISEWILYFTFTANVIILLEPLFMDAWNKLEYFMLASLSSLV